MPSLDAFPRLHSWITNVSWPIYWNVLFQQLNPNHLHFVKQISFETKIDFHTCHHRFWFDDDDLVTNNTKHIIENDAINNKKQLNDRSNVKRLCKIRNVCFLNHDWDIRLLSSTKLIPLSTSESLTKKDFFLFNILLLLLLFDDSILSFLSLLSLLEKISFDWLLFIIGKENLSSSSSWLLLLLYCNLLSIRIKEKLILNNFHKKICTWENFWNVSNIVFPMHCMILSN